MFVYIYFYANFDRPSVGSHGVPVSGWEDGYIMRWERDSINW
jgi:hypothetical protein